MSTRSLAKTMALKCIDLRISGVRFYPAHNTPECYEFDKMFNERFDDSYGQVWTEDLVARLASLKISLDRCVFMSVPADIGASLMHPAEKCPQELSLRTLAAKHGCIVLAINKHHAMLFREGAR